MALNNLYFDDTTYLPIGKFLFILRVQVSKSSGVKMIFRGTLVKKENIPKGMLDKNVLSSPTKSE